MIKNRIIKEWLGIVFLLLCLINIRLIQAADDLTLNTIKRFESFREVLYNDSAGYPTIGYGHLITADDGDTYNDKTLTQDEADTLLLSDISSKANIDDYVTVSLDSKQKAALTSLCFNIGVGNFEGSTVLEKINLSDFNGGYEYFGHWRKSGGSVTNGLIKRRFTEMFLFADKSLDSSSDTLPSEQWGLDPMPITDENWGILTIDQRDEAVKIYDDLVS